MKAQLLAVLAIITSATASEVAIRPNDFEPLELAGTCMYPVLKNGQIVLVDIAYPFDRVVVGDVIKFWYRGQKYAHRAIQSRVAANGQKYLVTKGDNVSHREIVTAKDYLGKVEIE